MHARFPATLWRTTLADLWRLLALSTAVLVTVIAFAAAVRPLADGKLAPADALRFMGLAMVPMLQYALPFAAAFAATLTYHRMAQDNELAGAYAAGVGHRTLLAPALLTAAILAVAVSALSEQVMPRFWRSMDRLVSADAARLVASTLDSGRPLEHGPWILHADSVRRLGGDERAYERLLLTGVLAAERDERTGRLLRDFSAQRAWVWFFPADPGQIHLETGVPAPSGGRMTLVHMRLEGVVGEPGEGLVMLESKDFSWPVRDRVDDEPRFLTASELARVPEDPDILSVIDSRRRNLAYHLAERATTERIRATLRAERRLRLLDRAGRTFDIRASDIQWRHGEWALSPPRPGEPIDIRVFPAGAPLDPSRATRLLAASAGLRTDMGADRWGDELTLHLEVRDAQASSGGAPESGGRLQTRAYAGLIPPDSPLRSLLKMSSAQLLAEVDRRSPDGRTEPFLARPANDLRRRIDAIKREVLAQRHERIAMSLACLVMVAVGAVTAMRLRAATPLAVYLWAFFPALAAVVTVSAGTRMVTKLGEPGLILQWSGVVALAAYGLVSYASVRRH